MSVDKSAKNAKTDWVDRIWGFFSSVKLAIFLLLVLAVLSIAGTVIEQNRPLQEYYRYFEPGTIALFRKIGLFDMYHSWWFLSCLALLALNITTCTLDRCRSIVGAFRKKSVILDEALRKSLQNLTTVKYNLSMEKVETAMLARMRSRFHGKPAVTVAGDGSRYYFFEKGRYSRLSFFLIHLSILVIFFGAIIGSFFGYKGYVNVSEGETVSQLETRSGRIKNLDFQVKCNSFTAEFYPGGAPMDYRSDLSIIQNGREVVRKTVRVNDPLSFGGVTFYQSSYGAIPERLLLDVVSRDGALKETITLPFNRKTAVPGTADMIEAVEYQDHFHLPNRTEGGRAIGINIYPEKGEPAGLWLLEAFPEYDKGRNSGYFFRIRNVALKQYTGLQVNRDPGEPMVWLGCITLIAGILIAFFMSHRKLWISLEKDKKERTELTMGGTANKNRDAFAREIERMVADLKEVSE